MERRPRHHVVYDACAELLNSVLFATLIIVIVFVPMLFLRGLEGRFFQLLGVAYMLSIGASLLVALTMTPAFSPFAINQCKMVEAGVIG